MHPYVSPIIAQYIPPPREGMRPGGHLDQPNVSWAFIYLLCFLGVIFLLVAQVIRADAERRRKQERELDELLMKFRHPRQDDDEKLQRDQERDKSEHKD